ncbi:ABC transporter permease [Candidatus Acetothermia bacterium]|jgi:putative ABC transport system permease protein|nr:ABC transporter permease [Candidatus Acetothermia bacterium]MCI2432563.1 ABC transporter permease [Candidatus Acetothermia bacterium]MCI2435860.1 ABC transporter permease [Candidatus Acetothermia bacterium]
MSLREALKLSWTNIRAHKLRNALAVLSVTIGIAAVIAIVTMTTGLQDALLDTLTKDLLRANMITVNVEGSAGLFGTAQVFSSRDVEQLRKISGVKTADVIGRVRGDALSFNNRRLLDASTRITTGKDLIPLDAGRGVQAKGEIVIGTRIAETICQRLLAEERQIAENDETLKEECKSTGTKPALAQRLLGKTLKLRFLGADGQLTEDQLQIVGIVKDSQFISGTACYVSPDYQGFTETIDGAESPVYSGVIISVADLEQLNAVQKAVAAYFNHPNSSDARKLLGEEKRVEINTLEEVIDEIRKNFLQFTAFLGAIAFVALLVGMIGVMNIMLITVKERTREIGVMKATGATRGAVLKLFLTESTIISTLGAALGVIFGIFLSVWFIKLTLALAQGLREIPFVLVPDWYAIAVLTGIVVGVLSGLYPAWQAARVNPIEALRYE